MRVNNIQSIVKIMRFEGSNGSNFLTQISRIFLRANDLDRVIIGMIGASVYDSGSSYT